MHAEILIKNNVQCGDEVYLESEKESYICQMVLRNRLKGEVIYVLKNEHERLEVKGRLR